MKKILTYIVGLLMFTIAVVGVLAKDAIPESKLYWYRLRINEPVITAFYAVPERKGDYMLSLFQVRMEDLLTALEMNSQSKQAEAYKGFVYTETNIVDNINGLVETGKVEVASNLLAGFKGEALAFYSLLKGFGVLGVEKSEQLSFVIKDLETLESAVNEKIDSKYKVQDLIKQFDDRLAVTKELLTNSNDKFFVKGEKFSTITRLKIEDKLNLSKSLLNSAMDKHSSDLDRDAYKDMNNAFSLAREVQVYTRYINYPEPVIDR